MLANSIIDGKTGEFMEYRHLIKRKKQIEILARPFSNELGRVEKGLLKD